MPDLIDISPPIHAGIAVWPGDVSYRRRESFSLAKGHNYTVSDIATTTHVGAHADAPIHYVADGQGIGERPLDLYYGPCQVIEVSLPRNARILPKHLTAPIQAPRVLLKTGSFPNPDQFNEDFNSLSPELVDLVADQGGKLVGIDTPSVDPFADKELESHHAVARHDMAVLEGLVLSHVPAGLYRLIALPLHIPGADASPVRAALLPEDPS